MAFLPDEQNLQNQQPQGAGATQGQAPITSSPAPASGGAGNKGTINQASSQAPAQPFTNLQTYLTANQPQIEQQGATISNNLTNQYGQTKSAIDQAGSDFGSTVKQGYAPNDAQVVNNFSADPSKVAADPSAAKSFQGMYNDSYTGPSSFESTDQYGNLMGQVQKGQQVAQQVSTPAGLSSYLQGSNPSETQGMATLDSSLLQGNPAAQQGIAAAAQPFNGLTDYLGAAAKGADSQVSQAVSDAQTARTAAQSAAQTATTGLDTTLDSQLAAAQPILAANQANYAGYQNNLGAMQTLQGLLGQIPLVASKADLSGIPAPHYGAVSQPISPSIENTATAHDYAVAQALQQLTGQNNTGLDPTQASSAGSFGPQSLPAMPVAQTASQAIQALQAAYPTLAQAASGNMSPTDPIVQLYNQLLAVAGIPTADQSSTGTPAPTLGGGIDGTTPPPSSGGGGHAAR